MYPGRAKTLLVVVEPAQAKAEVPVAELSIVYDTGAAVVVVVGAAVVVVVGAAVVVVVVDPSQDTPCTSDIGDPSGAVIESNLAHTILSPSTLTTELLTVAPVTQLIYVKG